MVNVRDNITMLCVARVQADTRQPKHLLGVKEELTSEHTEFVVATKSSRSCKRLFSGSCIKKCVESSDQNRDKNQPDALLKVSIQHSTLGIRL